MSFNLSVAASDLNAAIAKANAAAPQSTTYTRAQVNSALANKANTADLGTAATKNMDSDLSSTSENPVQNKIVTAGINSLSCVFLFSSTSASSREVTYQISIDDFYRGNQSSNGCGTYLVCITTWSTSPEFSLYAVSYSGGSVDHTVVTKIAGSDATVSASSGTISVTASGKIMIFAMK